MDSKPKRTFSGKKLFIIIPVVIVLVAVIVYVAYISFKNRSEFNFNEHLDDTAVTINGEALLYRELSFYVLYVEHKVERQARVYNPDSPKDWWNSYVNGTFVSASTSRMALDMAVHDHIMYNLAMLDGITLDDEDKARIGYRTTDFWEDLYEEQLEKIPVPKEEINETIEKIAYAEKYQKKLTEELGVNNFMYNYDGYDYNQMLEADYKVDVDDNYEKLTFGEITIHHNKVNFINGLTSKNEE